MGGIGSDLNDDQESSADDADEILQIMKVKQVTKPQTMQLEEATLLVRPRGETSPCVPS